MAMIGGNHYDPLKLAPSDTRYEDRWKKKQHQKEKKEAEKRQKREGAASSDQPSHNMEA